MYFRLVSFLRKILYPFSVVYGAVTDVRNSLYNQGILKSHRFDIPIIVVGNLSVGGTGKSPQIEYLIRLLKDDYKVAVLSRGYKRASKGFIVADSKASAERIGDEPMQFYKKFGGEVIVAVDADRVNGIQNLRDQYKVDVILLDDAYQHRRVDAGFNILLTPYDSLYTEDRMLPTGDLREKATGAVRAQVIVITKCPDSLSEKEQFELAKKLNAEVDQTVFFSKIAYDNRVISAQDEIAVSDLSSYEFLLVTGIANTQSLTQYLNDLDLRFKHISFRDHHHFSQQDHARIHAEFEALKSDKKLILTTEKDYVRAFSGQASVYYLPIKTAFIAHGSDFDRLVKKVLNSK